jgi:hypothetical protein
MTYFAQVENGIVKQVLVVNDTVLEDQDGSEFLHDLFGGEWIETSDDPDSDAFRGKYAANGDTWDGTNFSTPVTEETA